MKISKKLYPGAAGRWLCLLLPFLQTAAISPIYPLRPLRLPLHQKPVRQSQCPVGIVGTFEVMGDHEDGHAVRIKAAEEVHDLPARLGIEVPCRFVGQENRGLIHDGPGDGHPFLFSAGGLAGKAVPFLSSPTLERAHWASALFSPPFMLIGARGSMTFSLTVK